MHFSNGESATSKKDVRSPDAGTWLGLFHARAQQCHKHGAPARCSSHLPPHFFARVLGETSPLRSTSLTEAVRRGYRARDPHRKGKFPNHRSQYSLFVVIRSIPVELCGGSRVSGVAYKVNKHHRSFHREKCIYPNFAKTNVATFCSKILHPIQGQLAEVSRIF